MINSMNTKNKGTIRKVLEILRKPVVAWSLEIIGVWCKYTNVWNNNINNLNKDNNNDYNDIYKMISNFDSNDNHHIFRKYCH